MVLNLTQHVSVIPQSATITVTSGFMCLLVSILFTSPVWQLMEFVLLSENFNKGLMNESEDETEEVTSSNDDNSRVLELSSAEEAEKYYNNSEAWQRKVNGIINTYSNIHHPTKANHSQLLPTATCTQRSSPQTSRTNLLSTPSLSVMSLQTGSVTSWHFPLAYSQSTINGRTGSNACAFIALVLSKLHFAAPELPRPHHPLSLTWVFRMVQGMEIGNKIL